MLSCTKDDASKQDIFENDLTEAVFDPSKKLDFDDVLNEYSKLIGSTLQNSEVRSFVDKNLETLTEFGDKISLSYLIGSAEGLRKNEQESFVTSKISTNNPFTKQLRIQIKKQGKGLNYILQRADLKGKSLNDEQIIDFILANLTDEDLEIYVPHKELEIDVDEDVFYVSYEPSYFTKTNEAYMYEASLSSKSIIEPTAVEISDKNIEETNTYIVKPIDQCDKLYAGVHTPLECSSGKNPTEPIKPPEPLENEPELLTYNVDYTTVDQEDILSTRLARFRVKGTAWMGFGGTHQKLEIHRGSPDGKVKIEGGQIIPEGDTFIVAKLEITRRAARKKYWRDANVEFDNDWNISENEQAIFIFTKHHLKASASAEANVKAGLELKDGKVKPSLERTISLKLKVEVGAAKFREKRELSRRFVLANIVSKGVTGEDLLDEVDKVRYNVKQAGIFEYTLKHYYTDIK